MNHRHHQAIIILAGLWVLLAAVSATGQTVTTTVPANYTGAVAAAVNMATNKVYVASQAGSNAGAVTVINGATNTYNTFQDQNANGPQAVAVNPVTNKIYVANRNTGNVTVVDGSTDSIETTVGVGNSPLALAVNPQTNMVYVANNADGTVSVINGSTDAVVGSAIIVGTGPSAVAVNPVTNRIYVANSTTGTVSVINGATNTVVASPSDGNAPTPSALAVDPVHNQIYVVGNNPNLMVIDGSTNNVITVSLGVEGNGTDVAVNPVTNAVYVADTSNVSVFSGPTASLPTPTLITTLFLGGSPNALAVDTVSNKIYVANYGSANVAVIDGANNTLITVVDNNAVGPFAVTVNPVTNKIYVANNSYTSNVTVIDGADYTTTSVNDPSADRAAAVTVNPVTNTAYVANSASDTVTVITGSAYTASVNVGADPQAILADPLTNMIYVANYVDNDVSVISGETNTVVTTLADPLAINPWAVTGNPVTNTIYVANYGSNNVSVISGATNTVVATMADPSAINPYAVAVNPVTNTIYVANYTSGTLSVFAGDTNTLIATPVVGTNPTALVVNPKTNMIYVANWASNDVSVINGATNTVVATVTDLSASNPTAIDVNTHTNMIYVANNSVSGDFPSAVTVINGADNTFTSIDDPYACGPVALAVNHVSNKIYVANSCASYPYGDGGTAIALTVIDGATNSLGYAATKNQLISPAALAVNLPAGIIYVADSGSVGENNAAVIAEQQVSTIPITTTVTPLANNQTSSLTPTFTFTATNTLTAAPIDNLLFQEGTWQAPWVVGTSLGAGSFTGTAPKLAPGLHTLYAYATEGGEATSTNTGSGISPLTGNITAYSFLVPAPEARLSPGSLTFGSANGAAIPVDTTTPQQTVTLTNAGSVALAVTAVALSGTNPGDYSESDNCVSSSPIATQGTCTIDVTFTPRAPGARLATLVITDDSGDVRATQHQVSLTGSGVQATTNTTVTPSANPSVFGQSVTFTATVTPNSPIVPTGTVTFSDGRTTICNAVALASGEATCAPAALTVASHSIKAAYSGDSIFQTSQSPAVNQVVNPAATTTKITATAPTSIVLGQPLTVSYTVTVNAPGAGTIPGTDTVTVTDSTGASCTGTVTAGLCALTPQAVAADTLTATFAGDSNFSSSAGSAAASLAIAPNVNLTGLTATTLPDQSTSVGVALGVPASTQLSGTLTLSFASSAAGTPEGYIDPMTCFIDANNQCVTQINFTVAAGAMVGVLPNNGMLQQGTTAGTITVTMTALTAGGASVLPQPAPSLSVSVPPLPPVIKSVSITDVTSTGFNVQTTAYSTPRDLLQATFTFNAASGTNLNGSTPAPVSLSSTAQTYFSSANGAAGGGTFVLTVPFTYSGDTSALGTVTATLTNSVGASSSLSSSAQ